jgi:hypothetical protein
MDTIISVVFQIAMVVGIVFFIDKMLNCCCRRGNNHPVPGPGFSNHYAVRSGPFNPVPNPM